MNEQALFDDLHGLKENSRRRTPLDFIPVTSLSYSSFNSRNFCETLKQNKLTILLQTCNSFLGKNPHPGVAKYYLSCYEQEIDFFIKSESNITIFQIKTRMHSSRMCTARNSSRPGGDLHQAPPRDQAPPNQAPRDQARHPLFLQNHRHL